MRETQTPSFEIIYILALPDWKPQEMTLFQGFAPGLPDFIPLMERIPWMPADILESAIEPQDRLARRRSGEGAWMWTPVNLSTLIAKRKPLPEAPYMVVFSADEACAKRVSRWRAGLRLRPIHLSYHRACGALNPTTFTREQLRHRLSALLLRAASMERSLDTREHGAALARWRSESLRPSSLTLHAHNVTRANEMTLVSAGEATPEGNEGRLAVVPYETYVRAITESTEAVMALWPQTDDRLAYLMSPPKPDLILLAPSMYRGISKRIERVVEDPVIKSGLRRLDRQRGYTIELPMDKGDIDKVGPFLALRGAEMKLLTTAVGLRAAGTLAATIRLPPAVNRTAGVVGQLSRFLREHENPPRVKTARVFEIVQRALEDAIPPEHRTLIRRSSTGIKIIADAPIEWLPIDGLPLGIRFDVSRINSTSGNLFLEQIRLPKPLYILPEAFRDYLVLSMFEDGDPIAPHLRIGALHTMDGKRERIVGRFASPKSSTEFAAAIEQFSGPMLIVDSHAEHDDGDRPGGLLIGGQSFDVWSLMGKIRMPPIVILSACDTHPFDRSHATVANGFLACGAVAVVATALPIRSVQAARFVMRLINRAVHFGEIVNQMGRSVPWSHIVGGVLRMDLATDIIRGFERQGRYDAEQGDTLLLAANMDLNPLRPDWYDRLIDRIMVAGKLDRATWNRDVADIIAGSDAIRYVHLGNPEAVLVSGPKVAHHMQEIADEHSSSAS